MGPRGGDELNLIVPGKNYGWPLVSKGKNYDGNPIPPHSTRPDFEPPKLYWVPSVSPTSLLIYDGELFPQWKGNGFIGALAGKGADPGHIQRRRARKRPTSGTWAIASAGSARGRTAQFICSRMRMGRDCCG